VDIKLAIGDCNAFIKNAGLKGEYHYRPAVGNGLHTVECREDGVPTRIVLEDTLRNVYDELYREVAHRLATCARNLALRVQSVQRDPLPSRAMYETIRDLNEVAVDGIEARERDADGITDRLNVAAGQYAIERAKVFLDQYSDAYNGGDLK
jgi:hypothetical protein